MWKTLLELSRQHEKILEESNNLQHWLQSSLQWNVKIKLKGQGTGKICLQKGGFIISEFFRMYFSTPGAKNYYLLYWGPSNNREFVNGGATVFKYLVETIKAYCK